MSLLFGGFTGGEDVKERLSRAFDEGRMPHAVLLEGPPGSGTEELSAVLAKAAVCSGEGGRPCGRCPECVRAAAGSHPDILTLDGDADPRAFPVDAIRRIRSDAYVVPCEAARKVYVLRGVQNMAEVSQNALLKVLEEPPENVLFVLTATSAAALLPTVRSRVQVFSLAGKAEEGGWEEAVRISDAVTAAGEAELLFLTGGLIRNREKLRGVLERLSVLFRDAAVLRAGGGSCLSGQGEAVRSLARKLTRKSLLSLLEETDRAKRAVDANANAALLTTALCAGFRTAAGR
jgi:hypothetical protein